MWIVLQRRLELAEIMKKSIQDYCVLGVMCIIAGFLAEGLRDWSGLDFRFAFGVLVGGLYYDWYKKS